MDLSVRTTQDLVADHSWLGSRHGTEATRTVTLDIAKFTANLHYPNGFIPDGVVLGKVTAGGKYGPYDDAAVDGRQTAVGILFSPVKVPPVATVAGAALFVHGQVVEAKLPIAPGTVGSIDAAGKVDFAGRLLFW
jgi:hypothetical protein